MYQIHCRDGCARLGQMALARDGCALALTTPGILFAESDRIAAPAWAEGTINAARDLSPRPRISPAAPAPDAALALPNFGISPHLEGGCVFREGAATEEHIFTIHGPVETIRDQVAETAYTVYALAGCGEIADDPRSLAARLTAARSSIGYAPALYIPTFGMPHQFAALALYGVDCVDSVPLITAARRDEFALTSAVDGVLSADTLTTPPCRCSACAGIDLSTLTRAERFAVVYSHNCNEAHTEMLRIRAAISAGTLRNLAEQRVRADTTMTALLRHADFSYYDFFEARAPLYREQKLTTASFESLFRPEIERFRRRVRERYAKPDHKKILLLLPCSARKPYSFSQTHWKFREIVAQSAAASTVHEVILTSPLGIVPRELELCYPAQHYDVPVTGYYDAEERRMMTAAVADFVARNHYDTIINHLGEEAGFVDEAVGDSVEQYATCVDARPASPASLGRLKDTLNGLGERRTKARSSSAFEMVRGLARYQFGAAGDALVAGCTTMGRYPNIRLIERETRKQRAMLRGARGVLSLTLDGGAVLAHSGAYCVEAEQFTIHGDVFAMGIRNADTTIRIGDDVVVLQDGAPQAVGVALMNGDEMAEAKQGKAIKVRHYAKHG